MATFVLVHGVCHGAWTWETTISALASRGHHAVALDLPLTGLSDDAEAVTDMLDGIDGSVVLVGHSYGGLVISRAAQYRDDVEHLVYVAAAMVGRDEVFLDVVARFPPVLLAERLELTPDGQIVVAADAAIECFYQSCDQQAASLAASRMRPTAFACLGEPTGAEPWTTTPSTYFRCTQDRAVHPDLQAEMAARAGTSITWDTDHSPFMSVPELFVAALDDIATT